MLYFRELVKKGLFLLFFHVVLDRGPPNQFSPILTIDKLH